MPSHDSVVLGQIVRELLVRRLPQCLIVPEIWGKVRVSLGDGCVRSLGEVTKGARRASGRCVAVLDTSHLQQFLGHGRGDDARASRRRNQAHLDGPTLAGNFAGDGVRIADLVSPVATTYRHDRELGQDDGATDGSGYFLGALHTQADVTLVVTDGHESLRS